MDAAGKPAALAVTTDDDQELSCLASPEMCAPEGKCGGWQGGGESEPIADERRILPSVNTEADAVPNRDHTSQGANECQKTFL